MDKKIIEEFCSECNIKNYTINSDGSIDVDGNVVIKHKYISELPVKFNIINGDFTCSSNEILTTLKGCPEKVDSFCSITHNNITSLEYAPKEVYGFDCSHNNLTTFKGCPKIIKGEFAALGYTDLVNETKYILGSFVELKIYMSDKRVESILNKYKNQPKYLYKAISELKKLQEIVDNEYVDK
jgi:hypothetical protein